MRPSARDASAALLLLLGCARGEAVTRTDLDGLREELRALRGENEVLSRRLDALSARAERAPARPAEAPPVRPAPVPAATAAPAPAPVVPPDLAVVKLDPPRTRVLVSAAAPARTSPPAKAIPRAAPRGEPPPVPTSIAISEPDGAALGGLGTPTAGRGLAARAGAELQAARSRSGLERAHALEDFVTRYPRHAAADNALVEAAEAYAAAGRQEAACALAQRTTDEYPAGDAMSAGLERLAACEARRGAPDAERRILARLVAEHPGTPAAKRAEARLATISGNGGERSPRAIPARSSP